MPPAVATTREREHLEALETVALADPGQRVQRVLEAARDVLGMEISYFSEFTQSDQVILGVLGDADSFGFGLGTTVPLDESYCQRMVAGQIENAIPDTRAHAGVRELQATRDADLGAYVGVPLQLSDGRIYGTLCCAGHAPSERLDDRDVRFMRVLAHLLAHELEGSDDGSARPLATEERDAAIARLGLWFAGAPRAAPAARQALRSLDEHLPADALYTLSLLVTELVTNSVRHAGIGPASAVGLDVAVAPGLVHTVVSDPGPGFDPKVVEPELMDEGGRGLLLVESLSARWGVERSAGTRVWFELDLAH